MQDDHENERSSHLRVVRGSDTGSARVVPIHRGVLVLMVGLPMSGKTTAALTLKCPVVDAAAVRQAVRCVYGRGKADAIAQVATRAAVEALFRAGHKTVVLDACNHTVEAREAWECASWSVEYLVVQTSAAECVRRALVAKRWDTPGAIRRASLEYQSNGLPHGGCSTGPAQHPRRWDPGSVFDVHVDILAALVNHGGEVEEEQLIEWLSGDYTVGLLRESIAGLIDDEVVARSGDALVVSVENGYLASGWPTPPTPLSSD